MWLKMPIRLVFPVVGSLAAVSQTSAATKNGMTVLGVAVASVIWFSLTGWLARKGSTVTGDRGRCEGDEVYATHRQGARPDTEPSPCGSSTRTAPQGGLAGGQE